MYVKSEIAILTENLILDRYAAAIAKARQLKDIYRETKDPEIGRQFHRTKSLATSLATDIGRNAHHDIYQTSKETTNGQV